MVVFLVLPPLKVMLLLKKMPDLPQVPTVPVPEKVEGLDLDMELPLQVDKKLF